MTNKAHDMLETAKRRSFVIKKKIAGHTYEEIVQLTIDEFGLDRLPKGWDERYAYKDIKRELDKLRRDLAQNIEEVRQLEIERLDAMLKSIWGKVEAGDVGAISRALRISKRRSELTGIDAPTQISNITKNIDLNKLSNDQLHRLANGEDIVSVLIE